MPQVLPTSQKVGVRDGSGRFIDTFDLMIQLPWGALTTVVVHHDMTILQLKSAIEFSVGLPSDLLTLGYKRHASLADHVTLREMRLIPGDRINVILEYGFEELVAGAVSGNTQLIVNDIKRHWSEDDVERRRMVVMFIAAHRGFHYLIEKMLTDGAHPDSATPSGRTALHIACAMGNGGCIDVLLQHGANTTLKDANNKTPTQLAFSCGQQEAERRMVLYERARSRQTRRLSKHDEWLLTLPTSRGSTSTTKGSLSSTATKSSTSSSSWSRSPRFPVSRLARSVTPTLALQELSLSPAPGPELMVKSLGGAMKTKKAVDRWSVRRLTHANLEEFSQSSEGSVDSEPGKEEDLPTFDDQESDRTGNEDDNVTVDTIPISSPDDTVSTVTMQSTTPSPRPPPMPSAIRPPHVLPTRTAAWQQETRKVRFEDSTNAVTTTSKPARARSAPPRRSVNMSSLTLDLDSTQQSLTNGTNHASRSSVGGSDQQFSTSGGTQCNKPVSPPRNKPRAASARLRSPRYNPRYPDDRYGRDEILDMRKFKDIQASLELSVGLRETTDQPLLSNGRRKATPEENDEAFDNWLEGKVQGAKDRKLLNNVQKLLDEAFGRADEEIKRQEEKRPKITGQSFDDWKKQKDEETRNKRKALLEKQRQREEARKLQASIDAENELLIKAWVARKNEMEKKKKQSETREKKDKQRSLAEQQIAAQSAFEKWRLNKEWDELVRLREGQEFFDPALKATRESVKRTARKRLSQASIRSNKKTNLKYGS